MSLKRPRDCAESAGLMVEVFPVTMVMAKDLVAGLLNIAYMWRV